MRGDIAQFGWHVIHVTACSVTPDYSYTIGLTETHAHPELIILGFGAELSHQVLHSAVSEIAKGKQYQHNEFYSEILESYDVKFARVKTDFFPDYVGQALHYYNQAFELLQLVWPDREGLYPGDSAADPGVSSVQPILDGTSSWMFALPKWATIYTTARVLSGTPVATVFHDHDGDWQFLHEDYTPEDKIETICLEHMIELDPELQQLWNLKFGERASKDSGNDTWIRSRYESES